jgi:MSHA pilin protein MshA
MLTGIFLNIILHKNLKIRRSSMLRNKKGFTMIELVMVIVILGILAAIAVPRFIDLRSDAEKATAKGVAGAIVSSASMLHAQYVLRNTDYSLGTTAGEDNQIVANANISGGPQVLAANVALSVVVGAATNSSSLVTLTVGNNPYTLSLTLNNTLGPRVIYNF